MSENPLKYPWLKIVQFHKDFVQLEQANFFQIRLNDKGKPDPSKCIALIHFLPDSIDTAWSVPVEQLRNETIFEEIKKETITEGYLGGPCWFGREKDFTTGIWTDYISPLLYQHVKVEYDKEKQTVTFTPDEGRWEIPPLIYKKIEDREFLLDIPFEELSFKIIENAHLLSEKNNKTISENIIQETITRVPPLQDLFKNPNHGPNSIFVNNSNPWIFFIPPSAEKSYVRHLMPDYDILEQRLKDNPSDIGGLKILDSPLLQITSDITASTLYPILPLNQYQEIAVSGILDSNPITVISGPPGCGKSQVVVSLLLNAWAEGKSVLFASNTKWAVDVVYDRLKEYECEYPIAVRAGAKERNTIDSSLEKLKYLTSRQKSKTDQIDPIQDEIAGLYLEKQEYQQFLDNKIPQRITQAKQTATKSFLEYIAVSEDIALNTEQFQKRLGPIGYSGTKINKFYEDVLSPLKKWQDNIETCQNQIKNDDQQRAEYSQKIASLETERYEILNNLGYNSSDVTNFGWLISGPTPVQFEQWMIKYRNLLSDDIERCYSSSLSETDKKWNSESDARLWVELSEELQHRVNNLVNTNQEKFSKYNDLKKRFDSQREDLTRANLPLEPKFDKTILSQWKQEYSHYLSLPDSIFSILKKKGAENKLQQIEKEFQSYYPPEVWSKFSSDPVAGRKALSPLIDVTAKWMEILEEWQKFGTERVQIETDCKNIESIRKNLHLQKFIFNYSDDLSFIEISHQIKGLEVTAREAADTWCLHSKKERLLADLKTLALQFDMLLFNSPILKVWADRQGLDFLHIIKELKNQPTSELIARSWNYCSVDQFADFIEEWKKCQKLQKNIGEYTSHYQNVPTVKKRIADWWAQKPGYCEINKVDQSTLSHEGDNLHEHIAACEKLNSEWRVNSETQLHDLEKERRDHFNRAIENLTISYNNIPQILRDKNIDAVFKPILNQWIDDGLWIKDEDEIIFNDFNPERIQAKINQINSRLVDLSFSLAKEKYAKRIAEGSRILEDVDELRTHFKRKSSNARGFPKDKYRNALKAVPIWVTNAHSPQSFPMEPEIFDILVIDEASQCTLTNILPLIYRAKSLAVIGDPNQLSAIFRDISPGKEQALAIKRGILDDLELFGYIDNTMFEMGLKFLPGGRKNMINLVDHYRSHPLIIGFSNLYIYQMRLNLRKETKITNHQNNISGVFGLNVVGECTRGNFGKTWVNLKEARAICEIIKDIKNSEMFIGKSVGVVTPFSGQKEKINDILQEMGISSKDVLVGTVDTFQGNERDIMIFSPVISKGMIPQTANWTDDKNRVNVALTRARDLMVVVGNYDYCRRMDKILGKLIDFVETISLLRQTSMAELELFSLMIMEGNDLKINMNNLPKIHQRIGRIEVDFVLHNPVKGVHLVVEVDGKQHYYVEIDASKHSVKYDGLKRYVEINNKKHFFFTVGSQEFVKVGETNYPVIQTTESIQDDKMRDKFLNSEGYKVLRIHVRDIYDKPAVVINDIKQKLEIVGS